MSHDEKKRKRVNRWSRRFVATSAVFLVIWQFSVLFDSAAFLEFGWNVPYRSQIYFGVLGFVLHMVFGKGYTLIPSYFNCELFSGYAPVFHLPLSITGTLLLASDSFTQIPSLVGTAGSFTWFLGSLIFVGTLILTLKGNITGRETGTSDANSERERVDRYSNFFMPFSLIYLLWGSYELVAIKTSLPETVGVEAGVTHLFGAGVAALLILSIGFRLFPRFLVSSPPFILVAVSLPAAVLGPGLIAKDLNGGLVFSAGAFFEAVGVVGFVVSYLVLFVRTERDRVGFYGVLCGSLAGFVGVSIGAYFGFFGFSQALKLSHARLNILGFLGLTIIGAAYQFYPPKVGSFRGGSDKTALGSILLIFSGILTEAIGYILEMDEIILVGVSVSFVGSMVYAYILLRLFNERRQ